MDMIKRKKEKKWGRVTPSPRERKIRLGKPLLNQSENNFSKVDIDYHYKNSLNQWGDARNVTRNTTLTSIPERPSAPTPSINISMDMYDLDYSPKDFSPKSFHVPKIKQLEEGIKSSTLKFLNYRNHMTTKQLLEWFHLNYIRINSESIDFQLRNQLFTEFFRIIFDEISKQIDEGFADDTTVKLLNESLSEWKVQQAKYYNRLYSSNLSSLRKKNEALLAKVSRKHKEELLKSKLDISRFKSEIEMVKEEMISKQRLIDNLRHTVENQWDLDGLKNSKQQVEIVSLKNKNKSLQIQLHSSLKENQKSPDDEQSYSQVMKYRNIMKKELQVKEMMEELQEEQKKFIYEKRKWEEMKLRFEEEFEKKKMDLNVEIDKQLLNSGIISKRDLTSNVRLDGFGGSKFDFYSLGYLVPPSRVSDLIQKSQLRMFSLKELLIIIDDIYQNWRYEEINFNREFEIHLSEFVYNYFIGKHGEQNTGESEFVRCLLSAEFYSKDSLRVDMFFKFCSPWYDSTRWPLPFQNAGNKNRRTPTLRAFKFFVKMFGVFISHVSDKFNSKSTWITLSSAMSLIRNILKKFPEDILNDLIDKTLTQIEKREESSISKFSNPNFLQNGKKAGKTDELKIRLSNEFREENGDSRFVNVDLVLKNILECYYKYDDYLNKKILRKLKDALEQFETETVTFMIFCEAVSSFVVKDNDAFLKKVFCEAVCRKQKLDVDLDDIIESCRRNGMLPIEIEWESVEELDVKGDERAFNLSKYDVSLLNHINEEKKLHESNIIWEKKLSISGKIYDRQMEKMKNTFDNEIKFLKETFSAQLQQQMRAFSIKETMLKEDIGKMHQKIHDEQRKHEFEKNKLKYDMKTEIQRYEAIVENYKQEIKEKRSDMAMIISNLKQTVKDLDEKIQFLECEIRKREDEINQQKESCYQMSKHLNKTRASLERQRMKNEDTFTTHRKTLSKRSSLARHYTNTSMLRIEKVHSRSKSVKF